MKRIIKFRAWIPAIQTMLTEFAFYPADGMIGLSSDELTAKLPALYKWDGEHVTVKLSDDGETGGERVLETLAGLHDWLYIQDGDYRLMQFTGLTDKNGAEIYEGDIIQSSRNKEVIHVISYQPEEARFAIQVGLGFGSINQMWNNEFGKIVIGNIYEHPELAPHPHPKFTP